MPFIANKETLKGIADSLRLAKRSATSAQLAGDEMSVFAQDAGTRERLGAASDHCRMAAAIFKKLYDEVAMEAFK